MLLFIDQKSNPKRHATRFIHSCLAGFSPCRRLSVGKDSDTVGPLAENPSANIQQTMVRVEGRGQITEMELWLVRAGYAVHCHGSVIRR